MCTFIQRRRWVPDSVTDSSDTECEYSDVEPELPIHTLCVLQESGTELLIWDLLLVNPCRTPVPCAQPLPARPAPPRRSWHFTGWDRGGLVGCWMGSGDGGAAPGAISRGAEVSDGLAVVRACGWVWCGWRASTGAHSYHEPSTLRPSVACLELKSCVLWCAVQMATNER